MSSRLTDGHLAPIQSQSRNIAPLDSFGGDGKVGISPLALIERAGPGFASLYLSNGLYDKYGNFEGTERLARIARLRGVPTEWHPLYGGHCAIDIPSLANFLRS